MRFFEAYFAGLLGLFVGTLVTGLALVACFGVSLSPAEAAPWIARGALSGALAAAYIGWRKSK